jgi:hypothetical protein
MEYLLGFDDFKLNESQLRNVVFSLATFLGLGISKFISPEFIKGLNLNLNPETKGVGVNYKINF